MGTLSNAPLNSFNYYSSFARIRTTYFRKRKYTKVWGAPAYNGDDNTVMVHIRKLREKIEHDPSKPEYIKTVRGLGYKFVTK